MIPNFGHRVVSRLTRRIEMRGDAVASTGARPARDPRGGVTPVATLLERSATLHAGIAADEALGSRRHTRIDRWQRWTARLLPVVDGAVLLWFLTGVLNVDLRALDVELVLALTLALLCTVAVAAWTATVGEHLRSYKGHDRSVEWSIVDGTGRVMLGVTALMIAALGAMMFTRVREEVYQATGVAGTDGTVIAIAMTAAIVLVNLLVLYLSYADGSDETARLDQLGRAVGASVRRRDRDLRGIASDRSRVNQRTAAWQRLHGSAGQAVPGEVTAPSTNDSN